LGTLVGVLGAIASAGVVMVGADRRRLYGIG